MTISSTSDAKYLRIILECLHVCQRYRPKFGKGGRDGLSLQQFQDIYARDAFYSWFGLDSPLIYAAHRAAGGITSVYRQIGTACDRLFRQLIQDNFALSDEQVRWSYQVPQKGKRARTLSLDARIPLSDLQAPAAADGVTNWILDAAKAVRVPGKTARALQGIVFEVRQGYKSKDSKRQNADISSAANAYANLYLPCLAMFSTQLDSDLQERYARAQWVILRGTVDGAPTESTYAFAQEILGYDLAGFFQRNSASIRREIQSVVKSLLQ